MSQVRNSLLGPLAVHIPYSVSVYFQNSVEKEINRRSKRSYFDASRIKNNIEYSFDALRIKNDIERLK